MIKSFLFWVHIMVGLAGMALGFYLSLPIVITLVIAHRVHLFLFRGCFISRIQQALGHFPRQVNFLEVVARKLWRRDITKAQVKVFDVAISTTPVFVALVKYLAF